MTHLDETSLMFLHVEFNIRLGRAQSVLQNGENQKSVSIFCSKLWNFENSEIIIKLILMRKSLLKKKNHSSTSFKLTSKKPQIL